MNLLQIDSSILGDHSASRQLTAAVVAELRRRDATLTCRDVGLHPLGHLTPAHLAAGSANPADIEQALADDLAEGAKALEEFMAADVVVIGAPMYNLSISSQLKSWIDRLMVAGKTFRYTENGPVGLVKDKTVIIVSSRGGIYSPGTPQGAFDFQEAYLRAVFGFMGVTDIHIIRAEGLALSEDARKQALAAAIDSIIPVMTSLCATA